MQHFTRAQYKPMPWRNGRGSTLEIDRYPADGAYLWRLSQAEIRDDGPFSVFEGFSRWLCVLSGGPIFLNETKVNTLEPFQFSGDATTQCRINGGVARDLGLIYDRTRIGATMTLISGALNLRPGINYLFNLESGDTIKFNEAADMHVTSSILISLKELL